ncbi:2-keto-3-deoxy-L-rhamnonate aldolase RhmA/pimeloyl-ACP methyl ester carboxylesterase [Nakamurella sp. UYEF19]|uniref:aldolase/citrate lyase family protein n=1 Tax=Nakamurella sp. UYEF19 TaxID=1756392 RepID=UPI0033948F4E
MIRPPPSSGLAKRLAAREPLLGALLRMPNETLIEMTALVGMDFVVIDTEHGPGDQIPLTHHLMAAAAAGIPALVRVGQVSEILRVLDLGAAGIIAPHISTVEQAEEVVRAARYPPRGDRGFATYTRSGRHGLARAVEHLDTSAADTTIILMIEDTLGVLAAEEIAAVDGVSGLLVGPADLSTAMGMPGEQGSATVQRAIADVHAAARRAEVAVVTITADPAQARSHFAAGSTMVIYNLLAALGSLFTTLATGRSEVVPTTERATDDPVVFLPGMFGGPTVWDDVLSALPPTLTVRTGRIDLDDSVGAMAESVLVSAPERFSLVGHSLGGIVALEIARRAPHRLRRLVLLNAGGRGAADAQLSVWQQQDDRIMAGGFADLVAEQAVVNLGPAVDRPGLLDRWTAGARKVGPDGLRRQLAAQSTRPDSLPGLPAIGVPTLVVSGALDEICRPDLQEELAVGIPGAIHVVLPEAGHMTALDAPVELARLIMDFLTG